MASDLDLLFNLDQTRQALLERVFGRPIDEILEQADADVGLLSLADEARAGLIATFCSF